MEIPISMSWIGSEEDIFWLSRSVVRWPKQFSSIESVNRKLDSRGFNYSSSYLGGKGVVWTFESECDIYGVLLHCWCNSFFKKLGGQVGELVWVDEDTEFRGRFDKGRILVLSSLDKNSLSVIKVMTGRSFSMVNLVENSELVSKSWVGEFLGLRPRMSSEEEIQIQEQIGSKGCQVDGCHFVGDSLKDRDLRSSRFRTKEKKVSSASFPSLISKEVGGKRCFLDKGRWKQKLKTKNRRISNVGGGIRIGKFTIGNQMDSSEEGSSSTECGLEERALLGSKILKGECSKPKCENYEEDLGIYHCDVDRNRNFMVKQKIETMWRNEGRNNKGIERCINLREQVVDSNNQNSGEEGQDAEVNQNIRSDGNVTVSTSQGREGTIKELVRAEHMKGDVRKVQVSTKKKDNKGCMGSIAKIHPMTTRNAKVTMQSSQLGTGLKEKNRIQMRVIWNLEDELAMAL
ncbi:hypothetical protein QYF36_010589 [Acer negundo]|nr:hypothetical protein QYF36_010589 [Acer negundo]